MRRTGKKRETLLAPKAARERDKNSGGLGLLPRSGAGGVSTAVPPRASGGARGDGATGAGQLAGWRPGHPQSPRAPDTVSRDMRKTLRIGSKRWTAARRASSVRGSAK